MEDSDFTTPALSPPNIHSYRIKTPFRFFQKKCKKSFAITCENPCARLSSAVSSPWCMCKYARRPSCRTGKGTCWMTSCTHTTCSVSCARITSIRTHTAHGACYPCRHVKLLAPVLRAWRPRPPVHSPQLLARSSRPQKAHSSPRLPVHTPQLLAHSSRPRKAHSSRLPEALLAHSLKSFRAAPL